MALSRSGLAASAAAQHRGWAFAAHGAEAEDLLRSGGAAPLRARRCGPTAAAATGGLSAPDGC